MKTQYYKVNHATADGPFLVAEKGVVAEALRARFPSTVVYSHNELLCLEAAVKGLAAPKHNELLRQVYLTKKEFPGATVEEFLPAPPKPKKAKEEKK